MRTLTERELEQRFLAPLGPKIVGSTAVSNLGTGTSHQVALPTGIRPGDVIVTYFACDGTVAFAATPAGWNFGVNNAASPSAVQAWCLLKTAEGGETIGPFETSGSVELTGGAAVFRGVRGCGMFATGVGNETSADVGSTASQLGSFNSAIAPVRGNNFPYAGRALVVAFAVQDTAAAGSIGYPSALTDGRSQVTATAHRMAAAMGVVDGENTALGSFTSGATSQEWVVGRLQF